MIVGLLFCRFQDLEMSETGMGAVRSGGSSSEPGEEDYVTVVYNDEVKNFLLLDGFV